MAEPPRLPPGQRLVRDWPVLTYGATPRIDIADWRFDVGGEVEEACSWTWDQFLALGVTRRVSDIHCVTHWSRYDNAWEGVLFTDVLARIRLRPAAVGVLFHSYGGYTTNVLLQDLLSDPDAMFAHRHEGQPLARDHGGPMRFVLPSLYFWKSPKWVRSMEFVAQDRPGFWEMYGYHLHGDPWTEERYS